LSIARRIKLTRIAVKSDPEMIRGAITSSDGQQKNLSTHSTRMSGMRKMHYHIGLKNSSVDKPK
jgi:hypothetical protein